MKDLTKIEKLLITDLLRAEKRSIKRDLLIDLSDGRKKELELDSEFITSLLMKISK